MTMHHWAIALATIATSTGLSMGCGTGDSGDSGGNNKGTTIEAAGGSCDELSRDAVADTSVAADGLDFAFNDAMGGMPGNWTGDAQDQRDPSTTALSVAASGTFSYSDPVEAVVEEYTPGTSGTQMWGECPPYYETSLSFSLYFDKGLLSLDSQTTPLRIYDVGDGRFSIDLTDLDYGADLTPSDIDPAAWDNTSLTLNGTLGVDSWSGDITFQADRVSGDVAEAISETVVSWELLKAFAY
ncbi:MAG: hypothetical protein GXP62_09395 [Oligoflexia bacterium]|nr:hypothetical protein [Oligoflexia bacterium]